MSFFSAEKKVPYLELCKNVSQISQHNNFVVMLCLYHINPDYLDRQAKANSVHSDQ